MSALVENYTTASTHAVHAEGLVKRYGDKTAVAGVTIDVPAGSFTGLVGPNGAGKTTTLHMMTGLLRPDAGTVQVAGIDVWPDARQAKSRIGVLPDQLRLFDRLSGRQLLEYVGLLRGLDREAIATRAEELLTVLGLAEDADAQVIDYSRGMTKKIGLASALLHVPDVLFLDEPFEAIDPVSVRSIRTVLDRLVARGGTVVFSSHVMETVERVCDRVIVMNRGEVLASGTLAEVSAGRGLEDVFAELVGAGSVDDLALSWLDA